MPSGLVGKKRRKRIPPPPAPPASLVHLLQTEPAVLKYFQSLQANLESDVQIWKSRSAELKEENERLSTELKRLKAQSASKPKDKPATLRPGKETPSQKTASKYDCSKNNEDHQLGETAIKKRRNARRNDAESCESYASESPRQKQKSLFAHDEDESPAIAVATSSKRVADIGVPIDDSMFDDLDSDDDAAASADTSAKGADVHTPLPNSHFPVTVPVEGLSEIFGFLKEAYDTFQSFGIALVDVARSETAITEEAVGSIDDDGDVVTVGDECADDKTPSVATQAAPALQAHVHIKARSDERVITEILDRIHNNTLIVSNDNVVSDMKQVVEDFDVVSTENLTLCCNPLNDALTDSMHPLVEGKRSLVRALVLFDTFCSPVVSLDEWDMYFDSNMMTNSEELKSLKIGTRSRKRMVDRLLSFLDSEISERWACVDRAKRNVNSALHFRSDGKAESCVQSTLLGDTFNSPQLRTLVERSILGELATTLHLVRDRVDRAAHNIVQNFFSAAPSLTIEEYPKMPPAVSLLSLEGLLLHSDPNLLQYHLTVDETDVTKSSSSWFIRYYSSSCTRSDDIILFMNCLALVVHVSASIWNNRLTSSDERIHNVACIEMACYRRLLQSEKSWLCSGSTAMWSDATEAGQCLLPTPFDWHEQIRLIVNDLLDDISLRTGEGSQVGCSDLYCQALQLALIVRGDVNILNEIVLNPLRSAEISSWVHGQIANLCDLFLVSTKVTREIVLRKGDACHHRLGTFADAGMTEIPDFSRQLELVFGSISLSNVASRFRLVCAAFECSVLVADGISALRVVERIVQMQSSDVRASEQDIPVEVTKTLFDCIRRLSQVPVVRVINLERRKDRLNEFMSQAFRERLLVLKAVTSYKECERDGVSDIQKVVGFEFGLHAVDGQGRLAEANNLLLTQVGSAELVDQHVEIHWRPNDLKPFDINAPDSESLVRMSPSERACALSHVASWKGVLRSLSLSQSSEYSNSTVIPRLLHSTPHILRLFKISGFAEGPALLTANENMPPAPVCVILEDDAILVDRFAERLAELFKELPRDFHYCSIGYSRPKSAPIVPFSTKIGIPSMLWYLTGYCLSEEGANYLLQSLPVVGPVDSWVGLKMTRNWDNDFGLKLGVGVHAKPHSELPAHKDLCCILQFRAFCALQPLCTQKVRVASTAGTVVAASTGRNWRQRDTDIEYSGDVAKIASAARL